MRKRYIGTLATVAIGGMLTAPSILPGQATRTTDTVSSEASYQSQRQATLKQIEADQKALQDLHAGRLQLESRIEVVAAKAAEQRTNELLMSHQTTALRQLDSVLTSSQDNLLGQRDRFLTLGVMVRERASAQLIVVMRVDSGQQLERMDTMTLQIDSATTTTRNYTPAAVDALNAGAVDQVYHSTVLPATHVVTVSASVNGQMQTKAVSVDVPAGAATYVQFAVHNGQLVQSTWTNRSSTP
jgi:hypothetical protein